MKLRNNLFNTIFLTAIAILVSCQKEELNVPNQKVSICPEIAMNNFEEAGLMINEFLNNQPVSTKQKMNELLIAYFEKCDCVDTIAISSEIFNTYPAIREYSIRFILDDDTINKEMEIYLYNNSKVEFHKFHN